MTQEEAMARVARGMAWMDQWWKQSKRWAQLIDLNFFHIEDARLSVIGQLSCAPKGMFEHALKWFGLTREEAAELGYCLKQEDLAHEEESYFMLNAAWFYALRQRLRDLGDELPLSMGAYQTCTPGEYYVP